MVAERVGGSACRAPFLSVQLDPAWPGASTQGAPGDAPLDRVGRCHRGGAIAAVSAARHCYGPTPPLDGSIRGGSGRERTTVMTYTNRPIGLVAGSSHKPSLGKG